MRRIAQKIPLSGTQIFAASFAVLIFLGAVLLSLPIAANDDAGLNWLDALFTATSAVCVTGLVVVDTGTYFTHFGQLVILGLIQLGGLGLMTFYTMFVILLRTKISLTSRLWLSDALNQGQIGGIVRLTRNIVVFTFLFEGIGALLLSLRFIPQYGLAQGLYFGIFHSISAFCNAGFDLLGDFRSFTGYTGDILLNFILMSLIIVGGLGFTVIYDLYSNFGKGKLSLHTRLVLFITTVLIILGTLAVFLFEFSNPETLGFLTYRERILAALFQSVTPRTAGFNTIDTGELRSATAFFIIFLMFIGASPGSTGGGIKTTTFGALFLTVRCVIKGCTRVEVRERTLPAEIIVRAFSIAVISLSWIIIVTIILSLTEGEDFLDILFEVFSAFGTVGLSRGITTHLSSIGRVIIICTMFIGRVGPLTMLVALSENKNISPDIKYPEERIMIG